MSWWIQKIFISVALFALYIEVSPGLGGIWIRPDSQGHLMPSLKGFINYVFQPLHNRILWNPRILDANWFVFGACFLLANFAFFQYQVPEIITNGTNYSSKLNSSEAHPPLILGTES